MAVAQSVGSINSNMAEVKDALVGLNGCILNGLDNIILECDSLLVIDMIIGKSKVLWQMMDIIKQIQNIFSQVNCVTCHYFRESNQVANALVKWSIKNDELNTSSWFDLPATAKGPYRMDCLLVVSFRHRQRKNFFV